MISIAVFPKCWINDIVCRKMSLVEWIEKSVVLECEGLELYSGFLESHKTFYLSGVRQRVEALGMRIPMMCYSPDFTYSDAYTRRKEVKKQIEIIKVTAELGGSFCRILSGQRRPEVTIEEGIKWVIECIESCLSTAEKFNVCLVMENHYKDGFWIYPEFAQKIEVFLSIIDNIDNPFFGVQYDPSNAIMAGDDPVEILDEILPFVKTVHASDRYLCGETSVEELKQEDGNIGYSSKICHGVIGKGLIDYDKIFIRLKSAGFSSWISVEDGLNGMEEMKQSVDFLKKMRNKYFL